MYHVYALYNKDKNKIYIGQTQNLEERLRLHNNKKFSRSYTAKNDGKWILIHDELFEDRQSALKREKQLKSYRGREFVRKLIE